MNQVSARPGRSLRAVGFVVALTALAAPATAGELEVGFYGGLNESAHSRGTLTGGGGTESAIIGWQGKSFEAPFYYGVRVTYWPSDTGVWGFGIDFNHAKAYADIPGSGIGGTYSVLEFTDGLNLLTANAFRRMDFPNGLRTYVGVGAGLSIPHVEVDTTPGSVAGATSTFAYQVTGPAVQAILGASFEVFENWRVFAEYKLSYSVNDAALVGGGTFSTNLVTHHALIGVARTFPVGR